MIEIIHITPVIPVPDGDYNGGCRTTQGGQMSDMALTTRPEGVH